MTKTECTTRDITSDLNLVFWTFEHYYFGFVSCFEFRASACPGATAFEPESCYGETTKTLSENLIIRNPGLGQGLPVYPG
jgi:hypothetical protein